MRFSSSKKLRWISQIPYSRFRQPITLNRRKLAEVRDYLLPKLLSGQVRVEVAHG